MQYMSSVLDVALNIRELLEEDDEFVTVVAALDVEIAANPAWALTPVDDHERLAYLKLATGFVVSTEPEMNCYPMGIATTICFDVDGNPIP